ncbi:MAG: hypothetical protein MPL62_14515 [Alphaproteobacteria bacterium]|nr:hypothetical protein [Alphaproteobacteria bacterium]
MGVNSDIPKLKKWLPAFSESTDICYLPVKEGRIDKMEALPIRMWRPETNHRKQKR